jgi:uncharacterized membrane protein
MIYILVAALILIAVLFGISSAMQSYATAQQAQAAIEASRTAQVLAVNQLISTIVISVSLIVLLAVAVALVVFFLRRRPQANTSRVNADRSLLAKRNMPSQFLDVAERDAPVEWSFDPIEDIEYADLMNFMDDERRTQ